MVVLPLIHLADLIAVFGMQGRDKDLDVVVIISQKNFIAYWLETQSSHRVVDGAIWHVLLLTLILHSQRFIAQKESVGREGFKEWLS